MSKASIFQLARTNIAVHGVHLMWIGAGEREPCFGYTVGLNAFDHPELIVFGPGQHDAAYILNNFAFRVRDEVQRFDDPQVIQDFGTGYPAALLPVENSSRHLTVSNQMYRGAGKPPVAALQVYFPDADHRWPWIDGSTYATMPRLQPDDFDYAAELPVAELVAHEPK